MEAEETFPDNLAELRQVRAEIEALEMKRHRMTEERRGLRERIARLEANLPDETKRALGMGN